MRIVNNNFGITLVEHRKSKEDLYGEKKNMLKGMYILDKIYQNLVYPENLKMAIGEKIEIIAPLISKDEIVNYKDQLSKCEVVFSGWGCVEFDETILNMMPNLKVVFYGAGSIRGIVSKEFWKRRIRITSAYGANAVPVSEYTLSQILFGLKDGYRQMDYYYKNKSKSANIHFYIKGCYKRTVGIISLGMIGRMVCTLLENFDLDVIAYDPYANQEVFSNLNVTRVDSLDEIFKTSDLVSIHAPWLPETEGMITGEHISMMKEHAVLLNTARGAIIKEEEMIEVLKKRKDLFAILDVTHPEPPCEGSMLYSMENVRISPHIAGTMGKECQRMGQYMVDEMLRYLEGKPLMYEIDEKKSKILA